MRTPDAAFADPRLAVLYDDLDGDRGDLDAYLAIAQEVAARSVVDIGCGTGSLAVLLAARGLDVVGLDPARAAPSPAYANPCARVVGSPSRPVGPRRVTGSTGRSRAPG